MPRSDYNPSFDTPLGSLEPMYRAWKKQQAPSDESGTYDYRGAFMRELMGGGMRDSVTGHWSDEFKKPDYPTFSVESQYAGAYPEKAGRWEEDTYVPPGYAQGTDTVPARLTPKESVLTRNASELLGRGTIRQLNAAGNHLANQGIDLPTMYAQQGTEDVNMHNPLYYADGTESVDPYEEQQKAANAQVLSALDYLRGDPASEMQMRRAMQDLEKMKDGTHDWFGTGSPSRDRYLEQGRKVFPFIEGMQPQGLSVTRGYQGGTDAVLGYGGGPRNIRGDEGWRHVNKYGVAYGAARPYEIQHPNMPAFMPGRPGSLGGMDPRAQGLRGYGGYGFRPQPLIPPGGEIGGPTPWQPGGPGVLGEGTRNFPHPNAGLMHPGADIGQPAPYIPPGGPGAMTAQPAPYIPPGGEPPGSYGAKPFQFQPQQINPMFPAGGGTNKLFGQGMQYGTDSVFQNPLGYAEGTSDVPWTPITDPNDPRLLNTPLNDATPVAPVSPVTAASMWTPEQQAVVDRIYSGREDYTFGPGSPNPTKEDLGTYVRGPHAPAAGFQVERGVALPRKLFNLFTPDQRRELGIMDIAPDSHGEGIERWYGTPGAWAGGGGSPGLTQRAGPMQGSFAKVSDGTYMIDPASDYSKAVSGTGTTDTGKMVGSLGGSISKLAAGMASDAQSAEEKAMSKALSVLGGAPSNQYLSDPLAAYRSSLSSPASFGG